MQNLLSGNYQLDLAGLDEELAVDQSFDIINRKLKIGGRQACLYFIDGFVKDEIFQKLVEYFYSLKETKIPDDAQQMVKEFIPYIEVDLLDDKAKIIRNILSGVPCLMIEGYLKCIAIDARTYPARGVEQPDKDKVLRGSKDGFVETVVFNTALIRRRIRNPRLTMQMMEAGKSSKTDIVLCYLSDRVNQKLLESITKQIREIKVDALTMNQESLAECLYRSCWLNPFPKFKFTERPDAAAASILEGSIVILVDNSPSAMILPTSIFDIVEETNDYYFPPVTGTYLRFTRFAINLIALFITPLFLLMTNNPDWIPGGFEFIMLKEPMNIPLIWQFLILEFAIDGLRMASLNTPSMLSTPLSVVAALVIGDFTVSSGWFNAEAMLYMAFVAIANYSQVSFELGYAFKFMRIINLILTSIFGLWGFIGGTLFTIVVIVSNRTIGGKSYISPLIPFQGNQLLRRFFRVSLTSRQNRK